MPETVLKVKNLSVSLGEHKILKDIDFEVTRGETLAIIGPNGAGKTVLFRSLIGVLPHAGEIQWSENAKVGYVPQRLDLDPQLSLTLKDLMMLKARILHLKTHAIGEALALVHLDRNDLPTKLINLSAGKLQRAMIALALLGDANVLLFDEPTASVDSPREEIIYETLHELQYQKGLTLLLISHDLNLVYRHATKVLCLNRSVFCYGEPQQALTDKMLSQLYDENIHYYHHRHDK